MSNYLSAQLKWLHRLKNIGFVEDYFCWRFRFFRRLFDQNVSIKNIFLKIFYYLIDVFFAVQRMENDDGNIALFPFGKLNFINTRNGLERLIRVAGFSGNKSAVFFRPVYIFPDMRLFFVFRDKFIFIKTQNIKYRFFVVIYILKEFK